MGDKTIQALMARSVTRPYRIACVCCHDECLTGCDCIDKAVGNFLETGWTWGESGGTEGPLCEGCASGDESNTKETP